MKKLFVSIALLMLVASCAQTSNGVSSGALYTSWKDRDPISRVDNSVQPTKFGKACVKTMLGLVSTGDSSIDTAKRMAEFLK